MNRIIRKSSRIFIPLLALVFDVFALDEEASMAGFQFLDNPPAPRQIALGYAGTALGGYGFTSFNPASLMLTDRPYLMVCASPRPFDYTIASIEGAWSISNLFFGASVANHFIDGIIPADYNAVPQYNTPGSYDGTDMSLCVGYKNENLGLGLTINGLQERIVTTTAYGICLSAGIAYWLMPQKLSLGASVLNVGTTTGFLDETKNFGQGAPLPRSGRAGAAYTDTLLRIPYTVAADVVYRDVGNKITSASQIANRLTVPVGIEAWPIKYVAIRIGKRFNYETEIINFGAALRFAMLTLDMAFVVSSLVTDVDFNPSFALTYSLPEPKPVAHVNKPVPAVQNAPPEQKAAPAPVPAAPVPDTLSSSNKGAGEKPAPVPTDSALVPEKTVLPETQTPVEQKVAPAVPDSSKTSLPPAPQGQ
ncbi:MAG TPA: hypothetical protein VLX68_05420 [Chitinivibrionales bacterium]|nr:hypothetical protein [Chitinivibrionales bacterium]